MGLILLTKDRILSDFLTHDCPLLTKTAEDFSSLKRDDLCIVDADSVPPPYPASTRLIIARKKQETQIPVLLRPLAPAALSRALGQAESSFRAHLIKEKRALVTEKGTLVFPALEFALLEILFESNGKTVERQALCRQLVTLQKGASQAKDTDALLTVYIYRLRKKLAPLGLTLLSHRKNGYSLKV